MADNVETAIYRLRVEGQEQLDKLKTSLDGVTVAEEKVTGATRTTSATLQSRLARMDPLIRAQESYRKELESAARYAEAGIGTEAQRSAQIELATQRYRAHVSAIQEAEKATVKGAAATGLARHELVNLSRQFQDVAVSLGSGQSFGTVLLQQGTQIGDVFANSQGNVKGFFSQVASGAASILTPMRLVVGGALGLGAAAAYMALQWDDAQKVVERSLAGIGQRTGTTVADINAFSKANASATGLSITEARNVAIEFTKTGAIAVAGLHGVGEAVHGFATLTGTDATEATKKLAGAFSGDLAKGADELNKTYGFLDSATRKQIESLQLQGDRMGAVRLIIDRMAPSNIKAAESVGILTQAWTGFKNVISNIGNLPGQSDQDRLKALQAARDAAANTPAVGITPGGFLNTSAAFGGKSSQLADLDKQIGDLQKKSEGAAAQLMALSTAGDDVVKSIIPEIEQIDKLEKALKAIQDAKNTPGVSRTLGADVAAETKAQNLLAATREAKAEAERYNIEVANISTSWGHVGQAVALQLQAMQNALPVAREWTEAGKMKAQYEATYLDLLNQGKTQQEAQAVAAKQEEISKAAAVASAQKLVQASEDNLDKIRAEGTGMEGVLASSIAYRDAIQAGASATQAAAIAANTLSANFEQAARAAQQMAQAETQALNGSQFQQLNSVDSNGILDVTKKGRSQFAPDVMPSGPLSFGGSTDAGVMKVISLLQQQARTEASGIGGLAGTAYGTGGVDAAIAALKGAPSTFGAPIGMNAFQRTGGRSSPIDYEHFLGPERSTVDDKISTYDQLVQLKNAQTSDKGTQVANLKAEMDWLQTLPETISRDQKIISLQQSIDSLKNATDANTAATSATLNPLYSQGHGALAIGYYKAAGGLDMMAHGPTSGDQIPFHAMVNGGERITITPPGKSTNDNSRQVINNNNFVFNNATTSNARRSFRQFSQGFGQIAAAGS